MARQRPPTAPTGGVRWLIHLTSITLVGAVLGAVTASYFGLTPPLAASIGGLSLGTLAILRRWLVRNPHAG